MTKEIHTVTTIISLKYTEFGSLLKTLQRTYPVTKGIQTTHSHKPHSTIQTEFKL